MTDDGNNDSLYLTQTSIEEQDIEQEAVLFQLETGKTANKIHIRNRLTSTDRVLYYGDYNSPELDKAKIPWQMDKCDIAIIEEIVRWALDQPERVTGIILGFLDAEDKEGILDDILEDVGLNKVDTKTTGMPMTEIMRRALPATKEELIQLISEVSLDTKRPAATVRQWIRSDTRKGLIYLGDDNRYYHTDQN